MVKIFNGTKQVFDAGSHFFRALICLTLVSSDVSGQRVQEERWLIMVQTDLRLLGVSANVRLSLHLSLPNLKARVSFL